MSALPACAVAGIVAASCVLLACGGSDASSEASAQGCLAQAVATYDYVRLVRRKDGTLWKAAQGPRFERVGPATFRATEIAASGSSAYSNAIGCAIVDGAVWCFALAGPLGSASDLGAGAAADATNEAPQRVVVGAAADAAPLSDVQQLSGGQNGSGASFCALTGDGQVWCWGYSISGLLGARADEHTDHAELLLAGDGAAFDHVAEVRVGYGASCARRDDGSVWCWGANTYGELGGVPAAEPLLSAVPVQVPLERAATALTKSPGTTHCAILEDTSVTCWGRNHWGQAGAPDSEPSVPPTAVFAANGKKLSGVIDLAPDRGMEAMCANTGADGLWCWGNAYAAGPERAATGPTAAAAYGIDSGVSNITDPLSSYGATNGALVFVDGRGRLFLGAGSMPASLQPSCD